MARPQREFVVGLVALIGLAFILILTIQIKGTSLFEGTYKVLVRFPQVAGSLSRGGSVLVYGVKIGDVLDIRIDPSPKYPEQPVVVELRIRNSMTLYENAQVQIKESAIIGETTVVVGPGSPSHPVLADGMTIVGIDSGDIFEELRQQAPEIMLSLAESVRIINQFLSDLNQNRKITDAITDLASIIHTVQESITSGQGDLRATAQNMRQFSEHLNTSLDQFDETLTEVRGELRSTSEDLSRTLADLRTGSDERLEQAGQILDRVDRAVGIFEDYANTNAPRWAAITSDVESVADQLDRLLSRLESGEGTLGLIVHDEALYREMTAAFAAFNLWIGRIGDWLSGIEQPVAVRTVPYDLTARGASPSPSEQ